MEQDEEEEEEEGEGSKDKKATERTVKINEIKQTLTMYKGFYLSTQLSN